jgi:hypothetical protein
MGGNLTILPAGRKKTKAMAKAKAVGFKKSSGSFPIAAAAALPVFLEMAPPSGRTITEADTVFLDTCKEIQENALTQLNAEILMLTRVAEKAAEVEEVDDSEDGSDEDEDEDEDDVCPHMRATSDARWLVLFPGAAHASIISMRAKSRRSGRVSLSNESARTWAEKQLDLSCRMSAPFSTKG